MQLVGVIVGTYSSIFFATPLLVTLRERTELVRTHTRRVLNRRKPGREARTATDVADEPTDADAGDRRCGHCRSGDGKHAVAGQARAGRPARSDRPPAGPDGRRVSGTPGGGRPRMIGPPAGGPPPR